MSILNIIQVYNWSEKKAHPGALFFGIKQDAPPKNP